MSPISHLVDLFLIAVDIHGTLYTENEEELREYSLQAL